MQLGWSILQNKVYAITLGTPNLVGVAPFWPIIAGE